MVTKLFFAISMVCILSRQLFAADDDFLFSFGDRNFRVADVTGASFAELTKRCEVCRDFTRSPFLSDGGYTDPATEPFAENGKMWGAAEFLNASLKGTIEWFVIQEVSREFLKRQPELKVDSHGLDEYIQAYAELESKVADLWQETHSQNLNKEVFVANVRAKLMSSLSDDKLGIQYDEYIKQPQEKVLRSSALPRLVDGRPPKWMTWMLESQLLRFTVPHQVHKNKEMYLKMTRERLGAYTYLLLWSGRSQELDTETLRRLKRAGSDADAFQKLQRNLNELASDSSLTIQRGSQEFFRSTFGITNFNIDADPFHIARTSEGSKRQGLAICIGIEPARAFVDKRDGPGTFTFDTGKSAELLPLLRHILARIKCRDGITLRTEEQILFALPPSGFPKQLYGVTLPPVRITIHE